MITIEKFRYIGPKETFKDSYTFGSDNIPDIEYRCKRCHDWTTRETGYCSTCEPLEYHRESNVKPSYQFTLRCVECGQPYEAMIKPHEYITINGNMSKNHNHSHSISKGGFCSTCEAKFRKTLKSGPVKNDPKPAKILGKTAEKSITTDKTDNIIHIYCIVHNCCKKTIDGQFCSEHINQH